MWNTCQGSEHECAIFGSLIKRSPGENCYRDVWRKTVRMGVKPLTECDDTISCSPDFIPPVSPWIKFRPYIRIQNIVFKFIFVIIFSRSLTDFSRSHQRHQEQESVASRQTHRERKVQFKNSCISTNPSRVPFGRVGWLWPLRAFS